MNIPGTKARFITTGSLAGRPPGLSEKLSGRNPRRTGETGTGSSSSCVWLGEWWPSGSFLGARHDHLGAQDTVWGLVNCITENVDHHRGELQDRRLKSAWFGPGVGLKQQVFAKALEIMK